MEFDGVFKMIVEALAAATTFTNRVLWPCRDFLIGVGKLKRSD
jgi:hypothetical protein